MARPQITSPIGHVSASAAIIDLSKPIEIRRQKAARRPWQAQAWDFYRVLPEVRYPANFIGNALSRFTMRPGLIDDDSPTADARIPDAKKRPAIIGAAEDILAGLEGPQGGVSEIQRRYGLNMNVAADGWMLGLDQRNAPTDWEFVSTNELQFHHDGRGEERAYRDSLGHGEGPKEDDLLPTKGIYTQRFWYSHPEYSMQADGPLESLSDDCQRLIDLNDSISARLLSRLASAGILFLPNSLSMPISPQPEGSDLANMDPIIATIISYMTQAMANRDSAAGKLPIIMRGPDDLGEKIKHITLDRVIDESEMKLRDELRQTITRGQDLPVETQTEMGGLNHWCVDDQTEALTRDGWKSQSDLRIGDEVFTLNPETGFSEWQPVLDIYCADVVNEPVRVMDGRGHSSVTTLAHRWLVDRERSGGLVREFTTSEAINTSCAIPTSAFPTDLPRSTKWTDELVELVAWFGTDGYLNGVSGQIHQSHTRSPERVDRIRVALTRVFGPAVDAMRGLEVPAWRETIQSNESAFGGPITVFRLNAEATAVLTDHAPGRVVGRDFIFDLTASQLLLFTTVAELADGRHHRQGRSDLWQKNTTAIDAYELALILSGRSVSRHPDMGGVQVSALLGQHVVPMKAAHQSKRPTLGSYTGIVWCPTTENGTWFARRKGTSYFTGNSSWSVSDATVGHLQPPADRFADGLTRVFLRPALRELDFEESEVMSVVVIADDSNVVTRPNAAEDYRQLHDRITVSDRVLREKAGAEELDAPTDEEAVRILGRKSNNPYLATYGLPINDEIDWDKVASVGSSVGAPGVGGTPPSRLPADSSNPAGAPGDVRT